MRYPPRLSHLATRAVVVARLFSTYADAHDLDDEEARSRLTEALSGDFLEQVLASTWEAIRAKSPRLSEAELLDKIAQNLSARPLRPGRRAQVTPAWSAFFILADLRVGTATEAARRALETDQGRQMSAAGLVEVGQHLAAELLKKSKTE
jgi:hypothetical protein